MRCGICWRSSWPLYLVTFAAVATSLPISPRDTDELIRFNRRRKYCRRVVGARRGRSCDLAATNHLRSALARDGNRQFKAQLDRRAQTQRPFTLEEHASATHVCRRPLAPVVIAQRAIMQPHLDGESSRARSPSLAIALALQPASPLGWRVLIEPAICRLRCSRDHVRRLVLTICAPRVRSIPLQPNPPENSTHSHPNDTQATSLLKNGDAPVGVRSVSRRSWATGCAH